MLKGYLKISDNTNFQFVYASQCYQTFFSIYAKFTVDKKGKLQTIEFKLVNYKGTINLGFYEKTLNSKYVELDDGTLRIPLLIRTKKNNDFLNMKLDLSKRNIDIINLDYLNFNRFLMPTINNGCELFFDSEFNSRTLRYSSTEPLERLEFGKAKDMEDFENQWNGYLNIENAPSSIRDFYRNLFSLKNDFTQEEFKGVRVIGDNCIQSEMEVIKV